MNNKDFGKFISVLRKEKGLTQIELANRIHISDKAISRWENGKNYPDIEMLESLGAELGVSINELIACKRIEDPKKAEIETIKAYYDEKNKVRRLKNIVISLIISAVVWFFGIMNILAVILYFSNDFVKVEKSMSLIVGIDSFSWIPFVVFSITTLIIKIIWKKKVKLGDKFLKYMKADIIFHILFSLVSYTSFIFLLSKAF